MTRETYLILILGVMMVTSSFGIYHFANAQINLSDTNVGNDNVQPITPISFMNNTLRNLNDTQNDEGVIENTTDWTVVVGNWTILDGGLHGGTADNKTDGILNNIILSPEIPHNVTAVSTSFMVNNLNTSVPNYASIVFSFIDLNNYEHVGINFLNHSLYAVGYTMSNGNLVAEPFWPGVKTNLTYTPGDLYNLTLANQNGSLDLFINGTKYLSQSIEDGQIDLGDMGLNYGRIKDISYLDYKAVTSTTSN